MASGYLRYIEVHNFKSYKDTQRIGPFRRFSCIIGPNGSGKSNLVDAISFVLGVNATHLRGSNVKDLIFRADGESTKLSEAYVKLVYVNAQNEKTKFKRTIIPTSKQGTEFSINDEVVTWDNYEQELQKLNILVKAKNFLVFQGDVEALATKTPKALTELFETISGSSELKARYEELQSVKERAEENAIFNERKEKGIKNEKRLFGKQLVEAEQYERLVEKKKQTLTEFYMWQLYHIHQELVKFKKVLDTHKKKLSALQTKRAEIVASIKQKKSSQASSRKNTYTTEGKIQELRTKLAAENHKLIELEENISNIKSRLNSSNSSHADLAEQAEAHHSLLTQLQERFDEASAEVDELDSAMETSSLEGFQLRGKNLEEYNTKKQQIVRDTATERKRLDKLKRDQSVDQQTSDDLSAKQQEYSDRLFQHRERREQLIQRLDKVKELKQTSETKRRDVQRQLEKLQLDAKNAEERKGQLSVRIEEIQNELRERKADVRESQRDQQFRDLIESLKRLFPSVRGRLFDLIEPTRDRYKLAITVTLGKNIDSIVVDDAKTAKECIQYLREQRLGTATFIPLDTIQPPTIQEDSRQIDESVKLVMDVINVHHNYKKAVQYAVSNTLVCETLADANNLRYREHKRCKIVTVDGGVIHKSGLVTGGHEAGLASRARGFDQGTVKKLKDERDRLLSELAEIGHTIRSKNKEDLFQNQLAGLETRISYSEKDLSLTQDKIAEIDQQIASLTQMLDEIRPQLAELSKNISRRKSEIEQLTEALHQVEDRIWGNFAQRVGIEDIRDYEENYLRASEERTQKRLQLSNQISMLQNQLAYERSRNLAEELSKLQQKIAQYESSLESLTDKATSRQSKIDDINSKISILEKKLTSTKKTMDDNDQKISDIKKRLDKKIAKISAINKQVLSLEVTLERNRTKRHNIFQECKVEEIWERLPFESGEDMDLDEPDDSPGSSQVLEQEDQIEINFRKLPKHLKNPQDADKISQQFKNDLHDLSSKIDKIDPNLKATVHLQKVKERLGKTKSDLNDARKTSKDAARKFEKIREQRIQLFNDAFKPIADEIDAIYKALTGTESIQGGTAYLNVDDTNEPYLGGVRFHVMPPNKRFRDMEQLSGGEKTVAALALLFAMHSIHPAPFFLLDEVDAALDKTNIAKVARYMQTRKRDLQFIVVSLQDRFYENADGLVGVMFDQTQRCSGTLTLDLSVYN